MAVGNTFGATALSSYGGFWISFAIVLTPGGFNIQEIYATGAKDDFTNAFGFFMMGWFIFTTMLVICTLRSTVAFFFLFFTLDLAFLLLGIGYLQATDGVPEASIIKAGGVFGLLAAFAAWYNAFAGIADDRYVPIDAHTPPFVSRSALCDEQNQLTFFRSNSFFVVPVLHFPWSVKAREAREAKTERETV